MEDVWLNEFTNIFCLLRFLFVFFFIYTSGHVRTAVAIATDVVAAIVDNII